MPKLQSFSDEKNFWAAAQNIWNQSTRIALSGGSSADILDHVTVSDNQELWQVDERYINASETESNQRLIKSKLPHAFTGMLHTFETNVSIDEAVQNYTSTLNVDKEGHLFDLIILGVGPDGHIASIFPESESYEGLVAHTQTDIFEIKDRLTLTMKALLQSKQVLILLQGPEKEDIWNQIQEKQNTKNMPIRELIKNHPSTHIHWLKAKN